MADYPAGFCFPVPGRTGPHTDRFAANTTRTTHGSSTNTSLPPLPGYCNPTAGQRRPWGEDKVQLGTNPFLPTGYARYRHNFDSCHPVKEQVKRCDEYRFPKPMRINVGVFPGANICTGRHVYRSPTAEVFPLNKHCRTDSAGVPVLGKSTREALAKYARELYCTSRYDDIHRDTSQFMKAKLGRDAQYQRESIPYNETPTCCRVLNHPDPCPWCWTGGLNDHNHVNVPTNGKPCSCTPDPSTPCFRCRQVTCPHKHHCFQPEVDTNNQKVRPYILGRPEESCGCKPEPSNTGMQQDRLNDVQKGSSESDEQPATVHDAIDDIGPWPYDHSLHEAEEHMLLPNVYQFKFPSALHCLHTQNEHVYNFLGRHDPYNYYHTPLPRWTEHWLSMCRFEPHRLPEPPCWSATEGRGEGCDEAVPIPPIPSSFQDNSNRPNNWTFRDDNNLRIPCIPEVIGSWQKSEAQKRYHQVHCEPIPDLRDNLKYSKRVSFGGYNSSVYR